MYFLVNENLVSKYEQLLIFTDIDGFTLMDERSFQHMPETWVMHKIQPKQACGKWGRDAKTKTLD
jgi:hypothetical protein